MELGQTLTEFYSPLTGSARKQQLEQALHGFRTLPNAHLTSLEVIIATVSIQRYTATCKKVCGCPDGLLSVYLLPPSTGFVSARLATSFTTYVAPIAIQELWLL